ncbi:MAG: glycerophosphodiester phosphodiesterase family protein [Bacilli bacterium]
MNFNTKSLKIVLFILIILMVINIIPPKQVIENNPFIIEKGNRPLVAAHRGGKNLNPENTFKAFDYAINELEIEILELDLVSTSDKHVVSIHNLTINASSDVEEITGSNDSYYVGEHTYEELLNFNFGYKFTNELGEQPYKDLVTKDQENRKEVIKANHLNISTIDEIFAAYHDTDLMFIVEIKDKGEVGFEVADHLYELMNSTYQADHLLQRVIVGTFNGEVEEYIKNNYPYMYRGGSVASVTKFVITQMLAINIIDDGTFIALQIPTSEKAGPITLKLDKATFVNRAHMRNMSVQYWTINEKEEMRRLIKLGADVIMTDNPDILIELLEEMGF